MDRIYHVSFPGFGLEFEISPVAVTLGTFSVYWYGIIIAAAFLLGVVYCMKEAKSHNVDADKLMNCLMVGIVTAIIGARAYYVAFSWESFQGDFKSMLNIHGGGLAIYGGIIGALIGGLTAAKIQKMELLPLLDVVFPGFLLGQGIGRW
ncbi:MAG: prolipoprotein diacylglyceryl transferase, partial [Clostridia bacterium]|nr:prolipoprotein diacylglyceryl transferase [Clostridia bacterium]